MNLQGKLKLEEQKGITLIALIVTMVVLLILAGIAISSLVGDSSILRQAKRAETEWQEGSQLEKEALDAAENYFAEMFDKTELGRKIGDLKAEAIFKGQMLVLRINVDGYTNVTDYLIGKGKEIVKETNTSAEKIEFMLNYCKIINIGEEVSETQALRMLSEDSGQTYSNLSEAYDDLITDFTSSGDEESYIMITAYYFAGAMKNEEIESAILIAINQMMLQQGAGITFATPEEALEYVNTDSETKYNSLRESMGSMYWIYADLGLLTQATKFVINTPDGSEAVLQAFNMNSGEEAIFNAKDVIYMYNAVNRTSDQLKFRITTNFDSEIITVTYKEPDPSDFTLSAKNEADEDNITEGLDVSYVVITPKEYINPPSTNAEVLAYMTDEEKWNMLIQLANAHKGTSLTSKEEIFEMVGVTTEEQFWAVVSQQYPQAANLDATVALALSYTGFSIDEEYVENFNKTYNSATAKVKIVNTSGNAQLEYTDNYGLNVFKVEANGEYTFEMSYGGKVIDTIIAKVDNILSWSDSYQFTATYIDKNGATATIPAGFRVTTSNGYNTVADGLLVKSPEGSTYVWIPCTELPELLQNEDFSEMAIGGTTYTPPETFQADLYQAKDLEIIPNLEKYGGFYVGRYETSLQNGIVSSVRTYAAKDLIRGVEYTQLVSSINSLYASNSEVGSQLMTGSVYAHLDSLTHIGTSTSEKVIGTGREPAVSTFHIYNLHDNLWEVTSAVISAVDSTTGEYFDYLDCPVMYGECSVLSHRKGIRVSYPTLTDCSGGRICLYLK